MASTFVTLVKSADFAKDSSQVSSEGDDVVENAVDSGQATASPDLPRASSVAGTAPFASLAYNINIVLPESRDQAVYDALFRSLREHLR